MAQTQVLGSYSPEDVTIVISNQFFSHIINGFTEGSFVDITRTTPASTLYTGGDATHARVIRRVTSAEITVTLHQASESNDILSAILRKDMQFRDNTWLFNLLIKDNSGRSIYSASQAFIGNVPDSSYGIDIADRAWVISTVNMEEHLGGNAQITGDTFSTLSDLGYVSEDRWKPIV